MPGSNFQCLPYSAPVSGFDIVHPYMTIIGPVKNQLIVMKDMGESLSDLMLQLGFLQRWAQSAVQQRGFLTQVGISALNLVGKMQICHNDIRPPNIAVSSDNFCLVDFDMCRMDVPARPPSFQKFAERRTM
jgi:tRNA A-37 threonylcarbamoyl transferase component Bud32